MKGLYTTKWSNPAATLARKTPKLWLPMMHSIVSTMRRKLIRRLSRGFILGSGTNFQAKRSCVRAYNILITMSKLYACGSGD
jgi:hypothetical protein